MFEVVGSVLLTVPAAAKWLPALTPLAAAALALETLALAAVFAWCSLELTAANPLIYAVPMGLTAVLVAYWRYSLSPLT